MCLMEHNKRVYDEIMADYKRSRSVIVVHGTGLGKSFIVMELLNTIFADKKVLYVVPKHAVTENFVSYDDYKDVKARVDFLTYNYFTCDEKTEKAAAEYDVLICDEAHHLGSDFYGKNTRHAIELMSKDKYVLGLTATNVREDRINVARYFEETVFGFSTFAAIQAGLIPSFEYLICRSDAEYRKGYDHELSDYKQVVDYEMSLPALSEVVSNNPKKRWICFFSNIKAVVEYESTIRKLFPDDYKILPITSAHDTNIEDVSKYEKTVILSVDKLLEGVHIPGTQGIILFRKVGSLPVFQQILGRIVHIGETEHPLVLDCTETAVRMFKKLLAAEKEGASKFSPHVDSLKPILYCSLQNAEYYNLSKLLAALDEPEFIFRGQKYKNLTACCKEYGVERGSVLTRVRRRGEEPEDALEKIIAFSASDKEKKTLGQKAFEKYLALKGKIYDSFGSASELDKKKIRACCDMFKIETHYLMGAMKAGE